MSKTVLEMMYDFLVGNGSTATGIFVRPEYKVLTSNQTAGPYAIGEEYLPKSTELIVNDRLYLNTSIEPETGRFHETDSNTTITFKDLNSVPRNGTKFVCRFTPKKQ